MTGPDPFNANLKAVLVDPEDDGFYTSRAKQWATLCPHMNSTEHRVLTLLLDLCSRRNDFRRLTLAEIAALLPSGKTDERGNFKGASLSTIASAINALAAIGQITDATGRPLRISNKTKGEISIGPHRSLRHDCTASRNVRDALARVRGGEGDDAPWWPVGLGLAQNSVPDEESEEPAQNLVPPAQDSVPPAQDSVPEQPEISGTTSENTDSPESPSCSSSGVPPHTPSQGESERSDPVQAETGVCVDPETKQELKAILRANLVERSQFSLQKEVGDGPKIAMIDLAERCLRAGATVEDIDVALSKAINTKTEYPYTHGTRALEALIARKQGKEDPLGTSKKDRPKTNTWIDTEGFEWPHHEPYARACGGRCSDFGGKRYVAIKELVRDNDHYGAVGAVVPAGDAFSCPVCREAYKTKTAA